LKSVNNFVQRLFQICAPLPPQPETGVGFKLFSVRTIKMSHDGSIPPVCGELADAQDLVE
jgi:hypothetical protein